MTTGLAFSAAYISAVLPLRGPLDESCSHASERGTSTVAAFTFAPACNSTLIASGRFRCAAVMSGVLPAPVQRAEFYGATADDVPVCIEVSDQSLRVIHTR